MFSRSLSVIFLKNWFSSNHVQFLSNTLYLLKSVRANRIYLEKWQITDIGKTVWTTLTFYHFKMFSRSLSVIFLKNWFSSNHVQFLSNTLYLLKSVRANRIYLEKWQITDIGKTVWTTLTFYHFKMSGNIISIMWQRIAKIAFITARIIASLETTFVTPSFLAFRRFLRANVM